MLDEVTKPQKGAFIFSISSHEKNVYYTVHTIPKNFGTQIIMVLRSGALLKLQEDSK